MVAFDELHSWDVQPERARQIQFEFRQKVFETPIVGSVDTVAGADVSFSRGSDEICAAVVVLDVASLEPVEVSCARMTVEFPYIPGFLSFREAPPLLEAFSSLETAPDLVVCDGHGRAHPRRFGLACHIGIWLDLPTIGCAKNVLVGEFGELSAGKGAQAPLVSPESGEPLGRAVRTRTEVNPVFVSTGHRTDIESAVEQILKVSPRYKIPEPIRAAHREVNEYRRQLGL